MVVFVIILVVYLAISLLFLFYAKRSISLGVDYKDYIVVVLGTESDDVFADRLNHGACLYMKHGSAGLYYTGKRKRHIDYPFVKSQHTLDDAIQLYKILPGASLILVTSANHSRRAHTTFVRLFGIDRVVSSPSVDLLTFYGPFSPLGWWYCVNNIHKNFHYHRSF